MEGQHRGFDVAELRTRIGEFATTELKVGDWRGDFEIRGGDSLEAIVYSGDPTLRGSPRSGAFDYGGVSVRVHAEYSA